MDMYGKKQFSHTPAPDASGVSGGDRSFSGSMTGCCNTQHGGAGNTACLNHFAKGDTHPNPSVSTVSQHGGAGNVAKG